MDVNDETVEGEFESGGEASPAMEDDWDDDVAQESARKKRSVATKNYTLFQELTARMRAPRSASPRRVPPNTNNHGAVGENEFNFTNDDPDAEREAKRVADEAAAEAKRLLAMRIAPSVSDRFPNLSVRHFSETLGQSGNGWVRDEMMEAYQVMLIEKFGGKDTDLTFLTLWLANVLVEDEASAAYRAECAEAREERSALREVHLATGEKPTLRFLLQAANDNVEACVHALIERDMDDIHRLDDSSDEARRAGTHVPAPRSPESASSSLVVVDDDSGCDDPTYAPPDDDSLYKSYTDTLAMASKLSNKLADAIKAGTASGDESAWPTYTPAPYRKITKTSVQRLADLHERPQNGYKKLDPERSVILCPFFDTYSAFYNPTTGQNMGNGHYWCAIIYVKERRICHWDSIGDGRLTPQRNALLSSLSKYVTLRLEKSGHAYREWVARPMRHAANQLDASCGIYTLMTMELAARHALTRRDVVVPEGAMAPFWRSTLTPQAASIYRRTIACSLMLGRLVGAEELVGGPKSEPFYAADSPWTEWWRHHSHDPPPPSPPPSAPPIRLPPPSAVGSSFLQAAQESNYVPTGALTARTFSLQPGGIQSSMSSRIFAAQPPSVAQPSAGSTVPVLPRIFTDSNIEAMARIFTSGEDPVYDDASFLVLHDEAGTRDAQALLKRLSTMPVRDASMPKRKRKLATALVRANAITLPDANEPIPVINYSAPTHAVPNFVITLALKRRVSMNVSVASAENSFEAWRDCEFWECQRSEAPRHFHAKVFPRSNLRAQQRIGEASGDGGNRLGYLAAQSSFCYDVATTPANITQRNVAQVVLARLNAYGDGSYAPPPRRHLMLCIGR